MSSLNDQDKRYFEKILRMRQGYVLDYTDATFAEFFKLHNIDIHSERYQTYGSSKAKKMRSFWEQESDVIVSRVLTEMLDSYNTSCALDDLEFDQSTFDKCKSIISRLTGQIPVVTGEETGDSYVNIEFVNPNIDKLPLNPQEAKIMADRLAEARKAFDAEAYLCVVFMCGSILEGVLLGAASRYPEKFNRSIIDSKKIDGKITTFREWSLEDLINVAHDVGLLKLDVKKFSHGLKDFRNLIHPREQIRSGFTPDQHTARVCLQVLNAALASIAGER